MIILEDYDLPVISTNLIAFLMGFMYACTDTLGQTAQYLSTGNADIFYTGSAVLSVIATSLMFISITVCILVDFWWINQRTEDRRRWL